MTAPDRAAFLADLTAWTAANTRARDAYHEQPPALNDSSTWCAKCVWPVTERRCDHCRTIMRKRAQKARGAA